MQNLRRRLEEELRSAAGRLAPAESLDLHIDLLAICHFLCHAQKSAYCPIPKVRDLCTSSK
jgi:hypothetical protein